MSGKTDVKIFPNSDISMFERRQIELQEYRQERAMHAFAPDWREWGWFEPGEWFGMVEEIRERSGRP